MCDRVRAVPAEFHLVGRRFVWGVFHVCLYGGEPVASGCHLGGFSAGGCLVFRLSYGIFLHALSGGWTGDGAHYAGSAGHLAIVSGGLAGSLAAAGEEAAFLCVGTSSRSGVVVAFYGVESGSVLAGRGSGSGGKL